MVSPAAQVQLQETFDKMTLADDTYGSEEGIFITYIEGSCIYGRLTKYPEALLWEIHRAISESLRKKRPRDSEELEPGAKIVANVGDMYVRATVIEVYSPQHVLIHLLDTGVKELVHTYNIRPMCLSLNKFPRMAARVVLRESTLAATEETRTLTEIDVMSIEGEVHLLGTLLPSASQEKREFSKVPKFTLGGENHKVESSTPKQKPQPVVANPIPASPVKTVVAPPTPKAKIPQTLTLGSCQVEVIDAANGKTATVRRANSESSLKALETKLANFSSKYRDVGSVEVGDYLLALYGGEGHWWSRALVHEVTEDSIQIEYVDYGSYDYVSPSNIRELPRVFCQEAAHVATVDFDVDVHAGAKYSVVITAKLDNHGRLFTGYVFDQLSVQK